MRVTTDDNKFPGMRKFKVHGKELKSLPKSLFNLLDLEILDLSPERETCLFFQLTTLPREICQLALLKVGDGEQLVGWCTYLWADRKRDVGQ